jgi:hypothetical protein
VHRLLLLKVAESEAVNGLDPTRALQASGIGTPVGMTGFDLGRAIFEAVEANETALGAPRTWPAVPSSCAPALPSPALATSAPSPGPPPSAAPAAAPPACLAPAAVRAAPPAHASGVVERRVGKSGRVAQLG